MFLISPGKMIGVMILCLLLGHQAHVRAQAFPPVGPGDESIAAIFLQINDIDITHARMMLAMGAMATCWRFLA